MDISKLIEAAKVEGGEQAFGDLIQGEVQAAVTAATATITREKTALEGSITKLEGSKAELMDEWKPFQKALKAAGLAVNAAGVADLEKRLAGEGKEPTEDVMVLARQLAGPMAEEATKSHVEANDKLQAELTAAVETATEAVRRADRKHLDLLVTEATTGTDAEGNPRPRLIGAHRESFIEKKIAPFTHFEDTDSGLGDGSTIRLPVVRHGDTPIMAGVKQAGVAGLVGLAYEGKGDHPWNTLTRDYFESHGNGPGGQSNHLGGPDIPVDAQALGNTSSLADYREQRKKVS